MSPSLRKAAILVSSLDTPSADALLDQMGEAQAARVRQAIMELGEIDSTEQEQIIGQFLSSQAQSDINADVALELSAESRIEHTTTDTLLQSASNEPFAFLRQADGEVIAACLERERPQIAAVVLAHLSPEQAAEILSHLPAAFRGDVLQRIAHLNASEPLARRELEEHLQQSLAPYLRSDAEAERGVQTVEAILRASSAAMRNEMLSQLSTSDALLAREVAKVSAPALKAARQAALPAREYATSQAALAANPAMPEPAVRYTTSITFDELEQLNERGWRVLLQVADPELAQLALTGASPALVNKALAWLPKAEARRTWRRLEHPGPVRLRELDDARQELVELAEELEAEGRLRLPSQRRKALAA